MAVGTSEYKSLSRNFSQLVIKRNTSESSAENKLRIAEELVGWDFQIERSGSLPDACCNRTTAKTRMMNVAGPSATSTSDANANEATRRLPDES